MLSAGCEGKCGMAAVRLKPGESFDGESLYTFTRDTLPIYAAPRFVRIQVSLGALQEWVFPSQQWS